MGRSPMAHPPGSEAFTRPSRARSGPITTMLPLILRTSSYRVSEDRPLCLPSLDDTRQTGQISEDLNIHPGVPASQNRRDCLRLIGPDFQEERSSGPKDLRGLLDARLNETQSIRPAIERDA